jgi:ABC-type sulfate transport system permease component
MQAVALILLVIDMIAALILYGFFFIGIADGSVSEFNIGLWLLILAVFTLLVGSGWVFRRKGRHGISTLFLLPVAVPAALYGLFLLLILILQPRWN